MRPINTQALKPSEPLLGSEMLSLDEPVWTSKDTPEFRRISWAMFMAGFSSFSLIYCVQPLLPEFRGTFGVNAATASLALSLTTAALAFSILINGAFSQSLGRRGVMFVSMLLAGVCNILAATMPGWHWFLAARAFEGLVLGGVPAVAMAYLAEEIDPKHLGKAMGLYVGGTAFGAMIGRVGMGVLSAYATWHEAMLVLGAFCVVATIAFYFLLPPSRNFKPQKSSLQFHLKIWAGNLRNPALVRLYLIGAMLTSVFATVFNYSTFRLSDEPFGLGRTAVSMIFLTYGIGTIASSIGGQFADRFGRRSVILSGFALCVVGVLFTLPDNMISLIIGITLISIGFFIGHAATSGAVGANAGAFKSHASSLYLLFYYMGLSITGFVGGYFWIYGGWTAVAALTTAAAVAGLVLSLGVKRPEKV